MKRKISSIASSQIGLVRASNQDSMITLYDERQNIYAYLVLDGVGGSNAGDVASNSVANEFQNQFRNLAKIHNIDELKTWALNALRYINSHMFKLSHQSNQYQGMSTTAVLCLLSDFGDFYINIGDSRIYMVDTMQRLTQLSVDHSFVNDLVLQGHITPEQAKIHPMRHAVTNAVGIYPTLRADIAEITLPYHMLLLCSDGLSGYVEHDVIEDILNQSTSLEKKKAQLNQAVLASGAYDNFTFILVEVSHER